MSDLQVWDGIRPLLPRAVVQRQVVVAQDIQLTIATENVSVPTDWCFNDAQHVVVVHLDGELQQMESVFSRGPSSRQLPSVGDVWAIPADTRYAALAQGAYPVRFAEFKLPAHLLGGGGMAAQVGHRDPFLHASSVRAAALAARDDDLARMALQAMLAALRLHLADAYLHGAPSTPEPPRELQRRLSARQRQLLVDHMAAALHEPATVGDLAAVCGLPIAAFMSGFKNSFGTTPWQRVLRLRIARARHQLAHSQASISEIAAATGFASPTHFATSFARHVGTSPRLYRRAAGHDKFGKIDRGEDEH